MNAMTMNRITVGSFDAKTHFAELLRKVADGFIIDITKNGKKVAVLQSTESIEQSEAWKAFERINERRKIIAERAKKSGLEPVTQAMIKEWKNYGRKY